VILKMALRQIGLEKAGRRAGSRRGGKAGRSEGGKAESRKTGKQDGRAQIRKKNIPRGITHRHLFGLRLIKSCTSLSA
jgi:hypothetical protein